MTAVLLIADSQRVQRVFADLESKGVLKLHAAATLDQADQELTAPLPAFTFVQSRISGLSTGILLRHLKKRLPEEAKIILLYGEAADLQPGPALALPSVDLRLGDDAVAETVTGIVTGTAPPSPADGKKGATKREGGAKKRPRQEKDAPGKGPREAAVSQEAGQVSLPRSAGKVLLTPDASTPAGGRAKEPAAERAPAPVEPSEQTRAQPGNAAAEPPEQSGPQRDNVAAEPPPEVDLRDEEDQSSALPQPAARLPLQDLCSAAGEAVTLPAREPGPSREPAVTDAPVQSFLELVEAASARTGSRLSAPSFPTRYPDANTTPASAKRSKPLWLFLLLPAFLLVPSAGYLLGRISAAPEPEARQQDGAVAGQRGALFAAATSATDRTLSRVATATPPVGAQLQEAAQASGPAALPPFLEGLEVDRRYGDRHPGWERYLGANAEYKLFRQGGRYRAIQAIARADEIPDRLFRRVLLEFGAVAGYAVKSTEQKGEYLVEQATTSGSAALTIYRKMNDRRIKGLVVYYR